MVSKPGYDLKPQGLAAEEAHALRTQFDAGLGRIPADREASRASRASRAAEEAPQAEQIQCARPRLPGCRGGQGSSEQIAESACIWTRVSTMEGALGPRRPL